MITIGPTAGRGRGVFATRLIRRGETIEEAPAVVIPAPQLKHILKTSLRDYYFVWGAKRDQGAIALGLCTLCNHAYKANTDFVVEPASLTIRFFALAPIRPGEEVTVNYNIYNRLILHRGRIPHSGSVGWGRGVGDGRFFQTLFFRTIPDMPVRSVFIDFKRVNTRQPQSIPSGIELTCKSAKMNRTN